MNIEAATLSDINQIVNLKIQMFKDSDLYHLLHEDSYDLIKNTYTDLYHQKKAQHFLYKLDGNIIAMSGGFIKNDIPYCFYKNGTYGFIGDMYTKIEFRRQGLAQKLLSHTLEWFKTNNITDVQLLSSKDGKQLYCKSGFIENKELMHLNL